MRYAEIGLVEDIAAVTGGYPQRFRSSAPRSLVTLGGESKLVITAEHVARARDSSAVRGYLHGLVASNTSRASRLAAFAARARAVHE